jgi:nucleotide sugar dehydrogenase
MKYNVGIIGRGFVGSAILSHLKKQDCVRELSYDVKDDIPIDTGYSNIVKRCEFIYVCIPTPSDKDGKCFTGGIDNTLRLLSYHASRENTYPVVFIKSTMVPETTDKLQKKYPNLILVCNPEFLTERTAKEDVTNTTKHLIGLPVKERSALGLIRDYHERAWPDSKCIFTTTTEAELIKYTTNTFFSLKVTFANLLFDLCDKVDVNYSDFIESALDMDERLGALHWEVPGHDGKFGFGGKCFPKDLRGMIKLLEEKDIDPSLLKIVQASNLNSRKKDDQCQPDSITEACQLLKKIFTFQQS